MPALECHSAKFHNDYVVDLDTGGYERTMEVELKPHIPEATFRIDGKACTLKGENLGRFVAWLSEQGYKL